MLSISFIYQFGSSKDLAVYKINALSENYCEIKIKLRIKKENKIKILCKFHTTLREKCPFSELVWPVFSCIRTEYGEIQSISLYSVHIRENTDHKKLCNWTLFTHWKWFFDFQNNWTLKFKFEVHFSFFILI